MPLLPHYPNLLGDMSQRNEPAFLQLPIQHQIEIHAD